MVPYLVQLGNAYDANRPLEYDPYDLVRFALTVNGYWADKALDWLASGLPADPVASELRSAATDGCGVPVSVQVKASTRTTIDLACSVP
jgi:hypothetical protein